MNGVAVHNVKRHAKQGDTQRARHGTISPAPLPDQQIYLIGAQRVLLDKGLCDTLNLAAMFAD